MNPQVPQGSLNRLRGSVVFAASGMATYNITASFLGEEGINLSFEGNTNDQLGTMTGVANSPAPYVRALVEIELLKTQAFADQWKRLVENNAVIGDFTVIPDSATLSNYSIKNGAVITTPSPGRLAGKAVGYVLSLGGIYYVNQSLFTG